MSIAANFPLYLLNQIPNPTADTEELHRSLLDDLLELEEGIREGLASNEAVPFSALVETYIGLLFTTRIRALRWFAEQQSHLEQFYIFTDQVLTDSDDGEPDALAQLHADVRFALWIARRILTGIPNRPVKVIELEQAVRKLDPASLSYDLYHSLLILSDKPEAFLHGYFYFLHQGLLLEYGLLAACEVLNHPGAYGQARITELSGFIAAASQEIGAGALQLGIMQRMSGADATEFTILSEQELRREQQLAEREFKAWLKSLE